MRAQVRQPVIRGLRNGDQKIEFVAATVRFRKQRADGGRCKVACGLVSPQETAGLDPYLATDEFRVGLRPLRYLVGGDRPVGKRDADVLDHTGPAVTSWLRGA